MLPRMTEWQFNGWMQYYAADPWGEARADLRHGILTSVVAAPHVRQGVTVAPVDFIPDFGGESTETEEHEETPEQTQQMRATFENFMESSAEDVKAAKKHKREQEARMRQAIEEAQAARNR